MQALSGGLGAAVMWATASLLASAASRVIGAVATVAWVALIGLVVTLPLAAARPSVHGGDLGWLVLSGVGNVGGLLLSYLAYRRGKLGIVAPIVSAEGAVAAAFAVALGEPVAATTAGALTVTAVGVAIAARGGRAEGHGDGRAAPLAVGSAISFGAGLYAIARVGRTLSLGWALLPPRAVGTIALAIPLLLVGRLAITRSTAPLVLGAALAEVAGFVSFTFGARSDIAVSAVLSSLLGPFAALLGLLVAGERLTRTQLIGVGVLAGGVAATGACAR